MIDLKYGFSSTTQRKLKSFLALAKKEKRMEEFEFKKNASHLILTSDLKLQFFSVQRVRGLFGFDDF